jgi:hypothetical protein
MRGLLIVLLFCGFGGLAFAGPSVAGNQLRNPDRDIAPGPVAAADLRLGGDTCADAALISSLPFTDTATTCGFTNDYDYACPFTGSTAPDVVYKFTPAENELVGVYLCASLYDTKVFIYAGTCTGDPIACNDNANCGYDGYQSFLSNVQLLAGTTYFIVVDGSGESCGEYTITVTPPPPSGACCDFATGECTITVHTDCPFMWLGDGTLCTPESCSTADQVGACCYPPYDLCTVVTQAVCDSLGGQYFGDFSTCEPAPCPVRGACCFPTGDCTLQYEHDCQAAGGVYQGDAYPCDPNPCSPPVPVERTSWGRIKSTYR